MTAYIEKTFGLRILNYLVKDLSNPEIRKENIMSDLVVISFDDEHKAFELVSAIIS